MMNAEVLARNPLLRLDAVVSHAYLAILAQELGEVQHMLREFQKLKRRHAAEQRALDAVVADALPTLTETLYTHRSLDSALSPGREDSEEQLTDIVRKLFARGSSSPPLESPQETVRASHQVDTNQASIPRRILDAPDTARKRYTFSEPLASRSHSTSSFHRSGDNMTSPLSARALQSRISQSDHMIPIESSGASSSPPQKEGTPGLTSCIRQNQAENRHSPSNKSSETHQPRELMTPSHNDMEHSLFQLIEGEVYESYRSVLAHEVRDIQGIFREFTKLQHGCYDPRSKGLAVDPFAYQTLLDTSGAVLSEVLVEGSLTRTNVAVDTPHQKAELLYSLVDASQRSALPVQRDEREATASAEAVERVAAVASPAPCCGVAGEEDVTGELYVASGRFGRIDRLPKMGFPLEVLRSARFWERRGAIVADEALAMLGYSDLGDSNRGEGRWVAEGAASAMLAIGEQTKDPPHKNVARSPLPVKESLDRAPSPVARETAEPQRASAISYRNAAIAAENRAPVSFSGKASISKLLPAAAGDVEWPIPITAFSCSISLVHPSVGVKRLVCELLVVESDERELLLRAEQRNRKQLGHELSVKGVRVSSGARVRLISTNENALTAQRSRREMRYKGITNDALQRWVRSNR